MGRYIVNLYLPPPMEEETVPRPEGVQEIVDWWRPINQGESSANHLYYLYPMMLRVHVTVRVGGQSKEYTISVPIGTIKEDL